MYQLCSDLQVFIKCSSAQTVADGGLVSGGPWKVEAPHASASLVAGGVDRRSVWKELRLTGRGGRSGEKGYSDRSCVLCLVWSQKAKEDDEKNGEIGENEEG